MHGQKPRVEQRARAMVRARLRDSQRDHDICIIDVSSRGLLATTAHPPARGDFVELGIGCNQLAGQVKWAGEHRFGINLQERVNVAALIGGGEQSVSLRGAQPSLGHRAANARGASPSRAIKVAQYAAMIGLAGCAGFVITQLAM